MRSATAVEHKALDDGLYPLAMQDDLGPFLAIQYRARKPIEDWLEHAFPEPPPRQTPLLLADLGSDVRRLPASFPRWTGDERQALGVVWLLAGSSLGNRTILAHRRKAGLTGGESFLEDDGMTRYWRKLQPMINGHIEPAATQHAVTGARRGFMHFLDCLGQADEAVAA